jgi:hypothetical protein
MSIRSVSNPLPDDVPPGIDITQSKYLFGKVEWDKPPILSCVTSLQKAKLTRREEQDAQYCNVGNPTTWDQYITIGYFIYDDCFQFDAQWTKMGHNLMAKYKFIWFSYVYHTTRHLALSTELEAWALDIARPYISRHLPGGYDPDTTDPRNGRYDDSDDDLEMEDDRKPAAGLTLDDNDTNWTLLGANGKPVKTISPPLPKTAHIEASAPPTGNAFPEFRCSISY